MASNEIDLLVGLQRELSSAELQQVAEAFEASGTALAPMESGIVEGWDVPEVLRFRFSPSAARVNQGASFLPVSMVAVKGVSGSTGYGSWYNPTSWGFWPWNWFSSGTAKKGYAAVGGAAIGLVLGIILSSAMLKQNGSSKAATVIGCAVAGGVFGYYAQGKWNIIK